MRPLFHIIPREIINIYSWIFIIPLEILVISASFVVQPKKHLHLKGNHPSKFRLVRVSHFEEVREETNTKICTLTD